MTITAKWVGDVPAFADEIDVDLPEGNLSVFTSVSASLRNPDGVDLPLAGASFALDPERRVVTVSWGTTARFAVPGLHSLQLRLNGAGGVTQRLAPEPVVVEENSPWFSLTDARQQWADAPFLDAQLFALLESAKAAVLAYAPTLELDETVPANYRQAQLMQSRSIWNASKGTDQGTLGPEGFALPVYPLDKNIRQLLRPKRGIPVMW